MAVEAHRVYIDIHECSSELSVFEESPQLTHRSRSRDALSSANVDVFDERQQDLTPSPGIRQQTSTLPRCSSSTEQNGIAVSVENGEFAEIWTLMITIDPTSMEVMKFSARGKTNKYRTWGLKTFMHCLIVLWRD